MRRVRQFSYWTFLAFFGVVSVGGRGLHLLPGFAHCCAPATCSHQITACSHRIAACSHQIATRSHAPCKSAVKHGHPAHAGCPHSHHADHAHHAGTPRPAEAPVEPPAPSPSDDGCLLCQFCSQAKQQSYTIDLPLTGICFATPPTVVVQPSTTFERSYQSRAPPADRSAG